MHLRRNEEDGVSDPYARLVRWRDTEVTHLADHRLADARRSGLVALCGKAHDVTSSSIVADLLDSTITPRNVVCAYAWPACPACVRIADETHQASP